MQSRMILPLPQLLATETDRRHVALARWRLTRRSPSALAITVPIHPFFPPFFLIMVNHSTGTRQFISCTRIQSSRSITILSHPALHPYRPANACLLLFLLFILCLGHTETVDGTIPNDQPGCSDSLRYARECESEGGITY